MPDYDHWYPGNYRSARLWLLCGTLAKLAIFGLLMAAYF